MQNDTSDNLAVVRGALKHGSGQGGHNNYPAAYAALDAIEVELRDTREALAEACDLADEGWTYAGDYFRQKWDADSDLARLRALAPARSEADADG